MSEQTRLRVAFVLQTLLCLLRLYGNKQANSVSISVLRSIFDVRNEQKNQNQNASEEEMKYAFYYIWNTYQLIGSAGKAISTYYLSDVKILREIETQPPDYTVFRWLNVQGLNGLKQIEQGERLIARVGND